MTRFEIQDIIRQNQDGVTFRALDKSNDQIVSLRRFFPFGQCDENEEGGEGLDPTGGKAFSNACERLSHIQYPALRRTIFGEIDPIDGMPYLVTEWIEGESLSDVLGSNAMPADITIALVKQAFDVCKLLSETLQTEAIWIDTNPKSIIVCNPYDNPAFSFRICPFKLLGASKSQLKDMMSIVILVEALMGWESKLVSYQAGNGLGGYIRLLRQYPEMAINKAAQALPNRSIEITEVASESNTKTPAALLPPIAIAYASFFNKTSITIMSISALITSAIIFLFHRQGTIIIDQNSHVDSDTSEQQTDNPNLLSKPEMVTTEPDPAPNMQLFGQFSAGTTVPEPFSRTYQAEGTLLSHGIGRVDGDGWSANTAQDSPGHLVYGPYAADIPTGSRSVIFRMLVDNNTANNDSVVTVDVYNADSGTSLGSQAVSRQQWSAANAYQNFSLAFSYPTEGQRLEFRVYWHNKSYLKIDSIQVQ